jgi:hypothetical protein
MDMDVDGSGNFADFAGQQRRLLETRVHVGAEDLHVHGGGLAEIEDLGHDVGGLEEEFDAGEFFGKLAAEFLDIAVGGLVALLERDQDFAVERPDGAGIAVGQVDAAIGQAEIVEHRLQFITRNDGPHEFIDQIGEAGGLLDACAGRRPHVQADGGGVDAGKEILPDHENQP